MLELVPPLQFLFFAIVSFSLNGDTDELTRSFYPSDFENMTFEFTVLIHRLISPFMFLVYHVMSLFV